MTEGYNYSPLFIRFLWRGGPGGEVSFQMKATSIQEHIQAINACNQRGGRMLSLLDLIDAGSIDLPMAAYLAAAMRTGASLLVGANPGGAGKTAVMGALLNFLPDDTIICPVTHRGVLPGLQGSEQPGDVCYLAHEIGAGSYYAYIWGADARAFFAAAAQGYTIASNLHADTLAETRGQLCEQNEVPPAHLDAVDLKLYLGVERTRGWRVQRWVRHVYENDGTGDRLLWTQEARGASAQPVSEEKSVLVSPGRAREYVEFLTELLHRDVRHIEDVRRALVTP